MTTSWRPLHRNSPGRRTFKNYHDLLASDVDAVYIATPPYLHPEHFEAAVKARKHIFMEKPAGVDPAGCRRVVAAAKQADKSKRITVDYQQRYGKDYRRAYEIVQSGELGGIKMVRASWLGGGLPVREGVASSEEQMRNWLFYRETLGRHHRGAELPQSGRRQLVHGHAPGAGVRLRRAAGTQQYR